jgi:hypothetical protein
LRQTESEKMAVQFRTEQMLEKNTDYNISPESWFETYPQISKEHIEYQRGLKYRSLYKGGGFRFSEVRNLSKRSVENPEGGNELFKGLNRGLPGGGPELVVNPSSTRPWPWN